MTLAPTPIDVAISSPVKVTYPLASKCRIRFAYPCGCRFAVASTADSGESGHLWRESVPVVASLHYQYRLESRNLSPYKGFKHSFSKIGLPGRDVCGSRRLNGRRCSRPDSTCGRQRTSEGVTPHSRRTRRSRLASHDPRLCRTRPITPPG